MSQYLIRQAKPEDTDLLLKLARTVHFINLPPDRNVIEDKIRWSRTCFARVRAKGTPQESAGLNSLGGAAGKSEQFMFVLEDTATGGPLGTSVVISKMGSPGAPNVYMRLKRREFFSTDLHSGTTQVTATVELDDTGPTEIGGLILAPNLRGHPAKLGKQLAYVRFHYIARQRSRFQDRVIAEMMAPIVDGQSLFWECLGRRFINLSYDEADRFSTKSREFMTSLLPKEEIYLSLLPAEARAQVAQVAAETRPARAMLEKLGFRYKDRVDPFDAGPILEVKTDDIPLVQQTKESTFAGVCAESEATTWAIVSVDKDDSAGFLAVRTQCAIDEDGSIRLPESAVSRLRVEQGDAMGVTPE